MTITIDWDFFFVRWEQHREHKNTIFKWTQDHPRVVKIKIIKI